MSVVERLIRLPLRLVPRERPLRVIGGPLRGARWVPGAGVHGYWLGRYEPAEVAIFTSLIASGATVFDAGAHVGYYTLIASRLVGATGHVVAFEPNPRNLIYLRRHVTLNDCANVRVIAAAVADVAGHAAFQDGTRDAEGLLAAGGTLDVETVTLDAIAYGTPGLPPPSVLKIDVEGAEQRVLAGAERLLAEAKPDILLSTHGRDNYVGCQTTLARHGYHVRQMSAATKGTELLATARGS
jgi:FkbM family methyltransferase